MKFTKALPNFHISVKAACGHGTVLSVDPTDHKRHGRVQTVRLYIMPSYGQVGLDLQSSSQSHESNSSSLPTYMCIYIYVYTNLYVLICIYIHTDVMYAGMYVRTCVCTYVRTYVFTYVGVHVCIYLPVCYLSICMHINK